MIAARQIFLGRAAGGGWVNPYVTDGLVAMWDGEWNAGGGVHDGSIRTVTNLSTGKKVSLDDSTYPNNVVVGSNYIQVTAPCALTVPSLNIGLDDPISRTFEVVWESVVAPTNYNWNRAGWIDCGFVMQMNRATCTVLCRKDRTNYLSLQYSSNELSVGKIVSATAVTLGVNGARKTFFNGSEVSWTSTNYGASISVIPYSLFAFGATAGSQARIYSMRAYSRAITDSEWAANHAVDKERFNLP